MARGRPPKKSTAAVNLSNALEFVNVAQKDQGSTYETHCIMWEHWLFAFNGVLSAGCKIEEEINCCPRTVQLRNAIDKSGKTLSLTYQDDNERLVIKSDKFKASIPCATFSIMTQVIPDPPVALINDTLRTGFETIGHLAVENSEHVATASILLRSGSMLATDRKVIMEFWHGIDLPMVVIPKSFVTAIQKIKKKLIRFGFSDTSATFYFEDESWIKTQLYSEQWPEVDHILNKQVNTQEIPKDFFEALAMIDPFTETRLAYFREGVLASHQHTDEGVEYECNVPPNMAYNVRSLRALEKNATSIDFNVGSNESPLAYFYGENLRGAVAGSKYEYEKQIPQTGWSTAPPIQQDNDEQVREGLQQAFDPHNVDPSQMPSFITGRVDVQRGAEQPHDEPLPENDIDY